MKDWWDAIKDSNTYSYFNPFSKQYLFPENFDKIRVLKNFYKPYNFSGFLSWFLFKNFSFIHKIFKVKDFSKQIPRNLLINIKQDDNLIAFNLGSPGIENKITAISYSIRNGSHFFIKYGESEVSRKNINNEIDFLANNSKLDFIPRLLCSQKTNSFSMMKTNLFRGKKISNKPLDIRLIDIMLEISNTKDIIKDDKNNLIRCFSHGDFCPWNILVFNEKFYVFDWELSNYYPLGYDLFSYIFHTPIILSNSVDIKYIFLKNKNNIDYYYSFYNIQNWRKYLIEFSLLKIENQIFKNNEKQIKFFKELYNFAKQI